MRTLNELRGFLFKVAFIWMKNKRMQPHKKKRYNGNPDAGKK